MFRDSLRRNKVPDFRTMKMLVEGLAKEGKVEEAKGVIKVVKEKFPDDLVGGWKKLEKELGLSSEDDVTNPEEETA